MEILDLRLGSSKHSQLQTHGDDIIFIGFGFLLVINVSKWQVCPSGYYVCNRSQNPTVLFVSNSRAIITVTKKEFFFGVLKIRPLHFAQFVVDEFRTRKYFNLQINSECIQN